MVLRRALSSRSGPKLRRLLAGDTSDYGGDNSRADLALCSLLARFTDDAQQIDRIYRTSRLARPKWDECHYADGQTYGQHTVCVALERWVRTVGEPGLYRPVATALVGEPARPTEVRVVRVVSVCGGCEALCRTEAGT